MKRVFFYITFASVALIFFSTCAARQAETIAKKADSENIVSLDGLYDALARGEFRFVFHNSPEHYVDVSPGMVLMYVPCPNPAFRHRSINFGIMNFEYNVTHNPNNGTWDVRIFHMNTLNNRPRTLRFRVWEDGTATARSSVDFGSGIFRESRGRIVLRENNAPLENDFVLIDN